VPVPLNQTFRSSGPDVARWSWAKVPDVAGPLSRRWLNLRSVPVMSPFPGLRIS
jgi:hypothetical protein